MVLLNQCFLVKNTNGEPVPGALVMGKYKTGTFSWNEQYCRTNNSGICCLNMEDNVSCKAWIEEPPAGYAYLEEEQDFVASSSVMREFVLLFESEFKIDQEFAAQDDRNIRLVGACISVGDKTCCTAGKYVGSCHINLQAVNEYIADVTKCPEGYEYIGMSKIFTPSLTKVVMFTFKKIEEDCPAYSLLNGETTCMERDLWKCENGEMVKIEENSVDCIEEVPNGRKAACPIACVCMGTPLIDQLGPIREFRDEVLKRSHAGLAFVSLYYGRLSPHLSPLLEKSETLRRVGRTLVKGILWVLRK